METTTRKKLIIKPKKTSVQSQESSASAEASVSISKPKKRLIIKPKKISSQSSASAISAEAQTPSIKPKRKLIIRRKKIKNTSSHSDTLSDTPSQPNLTKKQIDDLSSFLTSIGTESNIAEAVPTPSTRDEDILSVQTTPLMFTSSYKMNIIVPFRDNLVLKDKQHQDRAAHLSEFKRYMTSEFLPIVISKFNESGVDAEIKITIVQQSQDGNKFNRGALLNIGYLLNPDFDTYVFHDVDLLPNESMYNIYATKYDRHDIIHFAGGWDRYSGNDYIGGVTLMGNDIFRAINGFPNDYWGWGGEDDEIKRRLTTIRLYSNLVKIKIPNSFIDLEHIKTAQDKRTLLKSNLKELDNLIKQEQAREHIKNWNVNGLNQSIIDFYTMLDSELETINDITYNIVDVELNYEKIKPTLDERLIRTDIYGEPEESKSDEGLVIVDNVIPIQEIKSLFDLSKYPMSFSSLDECKASNKRIPTITNPLVFYNLLSTIDLSTFNKKIEVESQLEESVYDGLYTQESIKNTFDYLFYKIKLGVFIVIKDNKLEYFIPFQNQNFINNWSSFIKFSDGISNIDEYASNRKEYIRDELNMDIHSWEANNCVLGTWLGNDIGDMGWSELRELLTELCANRDLNDCAFFYNRRDHPVLSRTKSEPYNHLFNSYDIPLDSHSYDTYIPIIGYCKNEHFADLLIPTYADWRDITKNYYPTSCQNMNVSNINLEWSTKRPMGVFRGSATGCGVTPETNDRIGISLISKHLKDTGRNDIIDAGLTGFNLRDKKISGGPVSFFKYRDYGLEKAERIPMNEQSNFKYIVHIDGHVSAYRLGKELSLGSTIIKIKSRGNYKVWFSEHLENLKKDLSNISTANYIEVDMPNLLRIIMWLRHNDHIAQQLAENALKLYNRVVNRDNIFNYMENLINKISKNYYSS
jgi:hypothetical protein